ncbi:MAG: hypothetical protein E7361_01630 [Clostridiales bacterium]|nr:hypothetical protein [Clostridiales bacterium]
MKKALKIILIILLVAGIGIGVYFIFFNIDRNLSVYNNTNDVMRYRHALDIQNEIDDLYTMGYANNSLSFNQDDHAPIMTTKDRLFLTDRANLIEGGSIEGEHFYYYGYAMYDAVLSEGIRYYGNFASLADLAKYSNTSVVNSAISKYKESVYNLSNKVQDMVLLQNRYGLEDSAITTQDLIDSYESMRNIYRQYLLDQSELVIKLRDFVVEESFDGNYQFETVSMLYDSIASTINSAMRVEKDQEINFLNDASIYINLYLDYVAGQYISYGISDEYGYMQAYSKLYYENRKDYNQIYSFTHFQKADLLHGDKGISSKLEVGYEDIAIVIMSILGL